MDVTEEEFASAVADGTEIRGESISAELIRTFCVHRPAEVDPRGIRLRGVRVVGRLDLRSVEVPFGLRFRECSFDAAPLLHGARVRQLAFVDCPTIPGLLGNGLAVQGDLDLSGSRFVGHHRTSASNSRSATIWLCESTIGGRLRCVDTSIDAQGQRAIHADRMSVGGTVRLINDFEARGELRLVGLNVTGSVDMTGAHVEADGLAVDLADATIAGNMFIGPDGERRRAEIRGRIDLSSTRIDGRLLIKDATLARAPRDEGRYSAPRDVGKALVGLQLTVGSEVSIEGTTTITGGVDLSSAELGRFAVEPGAVLDAPGETALDLTNAEVRSSLTLGAGVRVRGVILLAGAHIRGRLGLDGVRLSEPERHSLLKADGATIDGDVELRGLRATGGQLKFWHTTIGGSVEAAGAVVRNPSQNQGEGGGTLRLHQSRVGGSVRLVDGFTSVGCVVLSRTSIDGALSLSRGRFDCPLAGSYNDEGAAIRAVSASFRGGMNLAEAVITPAINLTDTTTTVLHDDPGAWPDRIHIAGFSYERFDAPPGVGDRGVWDWRRRLEWLRRQPEYDSGPYEQAARVFRQHGYGEGAEQLLIAQRKDARSREPKRGVALVRGATDWVYQWTVGYGYRPGRVLLLITALLLMVTAALFLPGVQETMRASDNGVVFSVHGPIAAETPALDPCGGGQVRCFNPLLYAVDTVVPLIALDQRATWYPDRYVGGGAVVEWGLNVATVIGWLLSSIFLLSFARLARNA